MLLSDVCLTSVAYIGPNSRTERPRKTKIGTEVAHVKGQGHRAALLTAELTREAGAAVTVRTYWAWGNCRYVASARRCARHWGAHGGGRRGGEGISCRHAHSLFTIKW